MPQEQRIPRVCESCAQRFVHLIITRDGGPRFPYEGTATCPACGHEFYFAQALGVIVLESRTEFGNVGGTRALG